MLLPDVPHTLPCQYSLSLSLLFSVLFVVESFVWTRHQNKNLRHLDHVEEDWGVNWP